jgi:hypothetical protein
MLLSIVVLSYNRPKQIERILENFLGVQSDDFNLVIKDDLSPLRPEITDVVKRYSEKLNVNVTLHVNETNMGYDMNLIDSFQIVESEYVFLLSDDDYVDGSSFISLLNILESRKFNFYFTPYIEDGIIKRAASPGYDINLFSNIIYNSILFSGLIFRRTAVCALNLNLNFLSNCIYSQVFIVSLLVYKEQAFGVMPAGILYLGGDGENYFGKNSSAKNTELLSERKQIISNLNYQTFLLRVVDEIGKNTSTLVKDSFMHEYLRRLIGYGFKARSHGLFKYFKFMKAYWSNGMRVELLPLAIFFIIIFVPALASTKIYSAGVNWLRKSG